MRLPGPWLKSAWRNSGRSRHCATVIRRSRRQWDGYGGYDDWFARDLNNAKLAGISTYYQWVPAFTALFARAGEDFAVFYRAVELIGQAPPEQRQALLSQLSPHSDPSMLARDVPTWAENP